MKQIDYSAILTTRSLLPRREHLYRAIRSKEESLRQLDYEFRLKRRKLEDEISELKLAKDSYSYTQEELELIARADSVIRQDNVQGVYQILLNGSPCYVGEAQCVKSRLREHAGSILRASTIHEMYSELNAHDPNNIDFCLLEVTVPPKEFFGNEKQWRLSREAFHGYSCIDQGHKLLNKGFQVSRRSVSAMTDFGRENY